MEWIRVGMRLRMCAHASEGRPLHILTSTQIEWIQRLIVCAVMCSERNDYTLHVVTRLWLDFLTQRLNPLGEMTSQIGGG